MLIGPVFSREAALMPRRVRTYVARASYGLGLLVLMGTAWAILMGTQRVRNVGDLARFGTTLFQVLAPFQLVVWLFFSAVLSASAVSMEKERRTLDLLLLTKLSNSELVLGKMLSSLLLVLTLVGVSVPVFAALLLFGGVSPGQIVRVFAVTLVSMLVCGGLGSTLALWREKSFQALAMTLLIIVIWTAGWGMAAQGAFGRQWGGVACGTIAACVSPWHAVVEATRPVLQPDAGLGGFQSAVYVYLALGVAAAAALNGVAIWRVRVWNPSRELRTFRREDETWRRASIWGAEYDEAARQAQAGTSPSPSTNAVDTSTAARDVARDVARDGARAEPDTRVHADSRRKSRPVWDNPVLWREIATWAYGRRVLVIRYAFCLLVAMVAAYFGSMVYAGEAIPRNTAGLVLGLLFLLSFVLVNALAVTSLTTERDAKALDLLLVSDLTPKEIVFGKLGGVFYNTKEIVLLPMALCVYLGYAGAIGWENLVYLLGGQAVLYFFVAVLGIHVGIHYDSSRNAVATSLGTVFFLTLGVVTCIGLMIEFSGSFEAQLQPFLAYMLVGGLGLYVALGARNPSKAIGVAAMICPFFTFYAITSFLLGHTLSVFLVTAGTYGFTTAAMLIPAIYEFDVATGRTSVWE